MTDIYPSAMYSGDMERAVEVMERDEKIKKRDLEGCRGCVHNSYAWGQIVCEIDKTPHSGGWCKQWHQA